MSLPFMTKTTEKINIEKKIVPTPISKNGKLSTVLLAQLKFSKAIKKQLNKKTIQNAEKFDTPINKENSRKKLVLKWNSDEAKRFDNLSNQKINKLLDDVHEIEGILCLKNKSNIKALNLKKIKGGLYLENSKNIDLSNLEKIDGTIIRDLESEVILNDELEKKALDYEFGIKRENQKVILDLNNLGDDKLFAYRDDRQLNLLLSDVTTINGDVRIMGRKDLNFSNLEEINGELTLENVSNISFPALKVIDGDVEIKKSSNIDLLKLERLYGDYNFDNVSGVFISKKMNKHIQNKQKLKKEEFLKDKEKELQIELMQEQIARVQRDMSQENELLKLKKEELEKNEQMNEKMLALKREEFETQVKIQMQQLEIMKAQVNSQKQGILENVVSVAKNMTTISNGINSTSKAVETMSSLADTLGLS